MVNHQHRHLTLIRSRSCVPNVDVSSQLFAFRPAAYSTAPTLKSTSNVTNTNLHSTPNYSTSSRSIFNSNHAADGRLPPSFHTFHPNQQQYQSAGPHPMYQSQIPMSMFWPTTATGPLSSMPKNQDSSTKHRRQSKDRGSSVEQGPRSYRPPNTYTPRQHHQPQAQKQVIIAPSPPQTAPAVEHLHYHRHHHHRGHPVADSHNPPSVPTAAVMKDPSVLPVESFSVA